MTSGVVFKYPLRPHEALQRGNSFGVYGHGQTYEFAVPDRSKFLAAQVQAGTICLWANVLHPVPPDSVPLTIVLIGTGQPYGLGDGFKHFATVQVGEMVWHLFGRQEDR